MSDHLLTLEWCINSITHGIAERTCKDPELIKQLLVQVLEGNYVAHDATEAIILPHIILVLEICKIMLDLPQDGLLSSTFIDIYTKIIEALDAQQLQIFFDIPTGCWSTIMFNILMAHNSGEDMPNIKWGAQYCEIFEKICDIFRMGG